MHILVDTVLHKNNCMQIQSLFYRNLFARIASYYCFMLEGIFVGVFGRYLPTIQDNLSLSDSLLGTSVLFVYLGTVGVAPVAAYLLRSYGSQIAVNIGAWLFIISLPLLSFPQSFGLLTFVMFNFGFSMGIMDISMNNCAILTEIVAGKPLLGSFHGSYSVAAALGSLLGGLYIQYGLSTRTAFFITAIVAFVISISTCLFMYNHEQELILTKMHDDREKSVHEESAATKSLLHHAVQDDEDYQPEDDRPTVAGYQLNRDQSLTPNEHPHYHFRVTSYDGNRQTEAQFSSTDNSSNYNNQMNSVVSSNSMSHEDTTRERLDPADLHSPLISQEFADQHRHKSTESIVPLLPEDGFSWDGLYRARKVIAYFSAVGFLAAFGESSIVTWSVVFFERSIPSSTVVKSLGFTSFMVCMAIGRFLSDYLRRLYGRRLIIRVGGVLALAGMVLVSLSPSMPIAAFFACLGFAITGLGLSTLIPIVFSSAGHLPDVHAGTAIATVAMCSYSGSIISSPLVGLASDGMGSLRYALLLDGILLGLICPLSWGIIEETNVFKSPAAKYQQSPKISVDP